MHRIVSEREVAARWSTCVLLIVAASTIGTDAAAQSSPPMTFFVTSTGNGSNGGNYGGLDGADARCQALATIAGADDRSWAAYLSTAPIDGVPGGLVHARDRIGSGPWHNFAGQLVAADLSSLHANGIAAELMLTETGNTVPASGPENEHDILTGSFADGSAMTAFPGNPTAPPPNCLNWTSASANDFSFVGHTDASLFDQSWNSQHESGCDEAGLRATAGTGRLYCFALAGNAQQVFRDGFEGPG